MQSILARIRRSFTPTSVRQQPTRPVELSAQDCRAVAGGLPRTVWSAPTTSA